MYGDEEKKYPPRNKILRCEFRNPYILDICMTKTKSLICNFDDSHKCFFTEGILFFQFKVAPVSITLNVWMYNLKICLKMYWRYGMDYVYKTYQNLFLLQWLQFLSIDIIFIAFFCFRSTFECIDGMPASSYYDHFALQQFSELIRDIYPWSLEMIHLPKSIPWI